MYAKMTPAELGPTSKTNRVIRGLDFESGDTMLTSETADHVQSCGQ